MGEEVLFKKKDRVTFQLLTGLGVPRIQEMTFIPLPTWMGVQEHDPPFYHISTTNGISLPGYKLIVLESIKME